MWKRLATFILTASFSVATGGAFAVNARAHDEVDGTAAVFSDADDLASPGLSPFTIDDAEQIDDAVDDRIAAWASLHRAARHVAVIHIEPLAAVDPPLLRHLLDRVTDAARRTGVLKLIINAPSPDLIAESDLCLYLQQRGFHFSRARDHADHRTLEFYTNLYYHPKKKTPAESAA